VHENNSPQPLVSPVSVSNGTTETSPSSATTSHIRISEGQLDEVVTTLVGRPREEVVRTLLDLAGRTVRQPGAGYEVPHNPRDQFEGLIGLLRLKSLRRDSRNFNFLVEEVQQAFWKLAGANDFAQKVNPLTVAPSSKRSKIDPEEVSHENLGTLVIDANGQFWKWNCGWMLVNRKGEPRTIKVAASRVGKTRIRERVIPMRLSHVQFASIPKATRLQLNTHDIQVARPAGEWRRWCNDHVFGTPTLFYHEIYKHVRVLASDGVHAVVRNYYQDDAPRKEVFFSSLSELKMSETKKSLVHKEKKAKPVANAVNLVISDELLKELLK
jgi:hypothetical protein